MIRSRSRVAWLLELALVGVLALYVRAHPAAPGAPALGFLAFLVAAIIDVAKWLADEASTIAVVLWNVIKIIGSTLLNIGQAVGRGLVKVWDFFRGFYSNVIKPFVRWAWTEIQRLHAWLAKTLAPVLKQLRTLRSWILTHYDKWLRPIFATLDVMRAMARTLAALHVPFAQAIDRKLADLEARLLYPIRLALSTINRIIEQLTLVIDFNGLFQRLTLIESLWHYTGDLWNVLLQHQPAGVSAADNATRRAQTVTPVTAQQLADQVTTYYASGAGELAPAVDAQLAVWRASAAAR